MPSESSDRLSVSLLCVELDYRGDLEANPREQKALLADIARVAGRHGGRDGELQGSVFRVVFSVPFSRMPARDAVAAAESLKAVLHRGPLQVTWRVAIATATSIAEGSVVYGDAMRIAKELLDRADEGAIEIDPETARLVASSTVGGRR
ncbi:MAG TPA: hypothetical protein VNP73_06745, partial [Actinomycetota bacterium]|nr:hypothetical protein [Actinomycetota bacterium]